VYCILFISIVCLYVNVWSVEYEQFEDFVVVEKFLDPEQFPELVEGKSLLHSYCPITTCILITLLFIIALH
jgi:hypothetical protein